VSEAHAQPESAAPGGGHESRGPSPLTRMLIRLGALFLIGALLFVFHGIRYYLTPWSQAIINGIVKYTYPHTGQKETTVLLFREENLQQLKEPYPVSYERHAMVVDALASFEPRAIFMDFVFMDKRDGIDKLQQAICDAQTAGIPVYVAVIRPMEDPNKTTAGEPKAEKAAANEKGSERPRPWLFPCAKQVSAQMAPVYAASGVLTYAHRIAYEKRVPANPDAAGDKSAGDKGVRHKTVSGKGVGAKGTDKDTVVEKEFLTTPAFAMASALGKLEAGERQDMEIIWGNGVPKVNTKWMAECARSGSWFAHLVSIFADNPLKTSKLRCPYTRTVSVAHLLLSSNDPELAALVHGKAVFYGAAFDLTGDRVASPVFDELPGVYLHAMAYDNLVTLGKNYKRAEREFLTPSLAGRQISIPLTGVVDALLLLVTVTIVLLVEEPPLPVQKFRKRFTQISPSRKRLVLGLITALVVVSVYFDQSLLAALGLLLLMVAITLLDLVPPAERAPESLQAFVVRRLLALIVPILAVAAFVTVDRGLGLEAALLLIAVPGYFLYRVVVGRDMLFAATAVLLVLASVVLVSPPVNLGPRNVIAYVAFFELARKLLKHADDVAVQYRELRDRHREDSEWGWAQPIMPALDNVFAVCRRTVAVTESKRDSKEEAHARTAVPA